VNSISPSSGTVLGGTSVTINGYAFQATQGSSIVTFNGTAATISSWTGTQIVALVPALAAGSVNIVVSVAGLQSTGMAFQVQATTNPLISNLSLSPGGTPSQSLHGSRPNGLRNQRAKFWRSPRHEHRQDRQRSFDGCLVDRDRDNRTGAGSSSDGERGSNGKRETT